MDIKKMGLIFVKNYLRLIVGFLLRVKKPEIIVITGTAGKTTTKETIYAVLRQKFGDNVARTHGSLSTKTGVPIGLLEFTPNWSSLGPAWWQWPWWLLISTARVVRDLFGLKSYPKLWVIEFAADKPGDFKFLLSYIHPHIAVVTNVGIGHTQFFGSSEAVAKEKSEIVAALPAAGHAILHYNNDLTRAMARRTKAKVAWVRSKGLNFAPAAARIIGRLYGMTYQEIERGLGKVQMPKGRMDIIKIPGNKILIDSSYNANPISLEAALEVLAEYPRKSVRDSRKIAILGDMLELGTRSKTAHQEVYKQARLVADYVVTIGPQFKAVSSNSYDTVTQAISSLLPQFKSGDIILVKGSHGVGLARFIEAIKKGEK